MLRKRFEGPALLILWMLFVASSFAPAQSNTTLTRRSEQSENYRVADYPFVPVWSGYGLIGVRGNRTSNPTVWASSSAGIEDLQFTIPGAGQLIIWSAAASRDHTITIAGTAVGNDSQGSGFIGIIPPDRSKKLIVRTTAYTAKAITIAPDGVIWTIGRDKEDGQRVYNVLKRFSPSGALLSSRDMTVKSIPGDSIDDVSNLSRLRSSADRVGWLTAAGQYLEFSLDGNEIGRFEAPAYEPKKLNGFVLPMFFYLALGENNEVVVGGIGSKRPISSLWRLNRDARQWTAINVSGEQISPSAWLLGFDGSELIIDTETSNRGELVARFSFPSGS
jgi:hypothetical protein